MGYRQMKVGSYPVVQSGSSNIWSGLKKKKSIDNYSYPSVFIDNAVTQHTIRKISLVKVDYYPKTTRTGLDTD